MDKNTLYWLSRTAVKLNKLFMSGVDLKQPYRWVYDWNDSLQIVENLNNTAEEDKALATFTTVGIIETESLNNRYRHTLLNDPENLPTGISGWGDMDNPDPALREYDRACFIEAFHYGKFIEFCGEHSLNYKDEGIAAELSITEQKPSVRAEGKQYNLEVLHTGLTLEIIEQALAHTDEAITFARLRHWTGRPYANKSQDNFKQVLRNNEFSEGNILHPFASISTKTFMLKPNAVLTPAQLSAIQKASIN